MPISIRQRKKKRQMIDTNNLEVGLFRVLE